MYSFPGEDSIMARNLEVWEGTEIPDFGAHLLTCPCDEMTEEEYEEDLGSSCKCQEIQSEWNID